MPIAARTMIAMGSSIVGRMASTNGTWIQIGQSAVGSIGALAFIFAFMWCA